jgi:DNA-binding protein
VKEDKKSNKKQEKESKDSQGFNGEPVVLVGNKNVMSYVLACVTLFNKGADYVSIKARGRLISRAVDVAEITRNRFVDGLCVRKIDIGTTTVKTDKGSDLNVSTIDIVIAKKD